MGDGRCRRSERTRAGMRKPIAVALLALTATLARHAASADELRLRQLNEHRLVIEVRLVEHAATSAPTPSCRRSSRTAGAEAWAPFARCRAESGQSSTVDGAVAAWKCQIRSCWTGSEPAVRIPFRSAKSAHLGHSFFAPDQRSDAAQCDHFGVAFGAVKAGA
jgi:hypothetical protein